MEIRAVAGDIASVEAGAIVVNLFEGIKRPGGATGAVDKALGGAITSLIQQGEIRGKKAEVTIIHTFGKLPAQRVLVAGLGKEAEFNTDVVRQVTAAFCKRLRDIGVDKAATIAHGAGIGGLSAEASAQAVAEGAVLGLYTFRKYKMNDEDEAKRELKELLVVERDSGKVSALQSGIDVGKVAAEAACLARDMVNEPANTMTPTRMAEIAGQIAQEQRLEITVMDRRQCQELGMGAFLAVAKGSVEEPKLIVLRYWGDRQHPDNNLGIVGKGITFDSGGLNLKALYDKLYEMKGDMAGGAAVLAAIKAIAQLKPKINVTAIVPATENLPSGNATRAGDIVRAMNGKSVEIENTDAEGRLALADAVCYARKLGLKRLVDVATLTGAITIALGDVRTGAFGNNQEWTDRVLKAGQAAGEPMWPFPLDAEYKEQNKSKVADIKNIGGRPAGSITGALFIGEFAEDTPWVHLDIAGVNMRDKERGYLPAGGTGIAVRSLVSLALDLARG